MEVSLDGGDGGYINPQKNVRGGHVGEGQHPVAVSKGSSFDSSLQNDSSLEMRRAGFGGVGHVNFH